MSDYQDYLCIGGPCDGEFVSLERPPRHGEHVEATKNRELAILEEIDQTALWASQERFIYVAHMWTDQDLSQRIYLLPLNVKNPWTGWNMLDHLVSLAYPQTGIRARR